MRSWLISVSAVVSLALEASDRIVPIAGNELAERDQTYRARNGDAFAVEYGFDYHGGDYKEITNANLHDCHDCINYCAAHSSCRAISYTGKSCWLKSTVEVAVANNRVTGAVRLRYVPSPIACPIDGGEQRVQADGKRYTVECGMDRPHGDIKSIPTLNFANCVKLCDETEGSQPSDDCELLAEKTHVPLAQLLSYNHALQLRCRAVAGLSYCKGKNEESYSTARHELAGRQVSGSAPDQVSTLITILFIKKTADILLQMLWNAKTRPVFNNLSYADLSDYLLRSPDGQSILQDPGPADYIACNLAVLNDAVAKWAGPPQSLLCICFDETTCCEPADDCPNPASKRQLVRETSLGRVIPNDKSDLVERASNNYPWSATDPSGQSYSGSYTAISWPLPSEFDAADWIWQHVFAMDFNDDYTSLSPLEYTQSQLSTLSNNGNYGVDEFDFAQSAFSAVPAPSSLPHGPSTYRIFLSLRRDTRDYFKYGTAYENRKAQG
ncbi:hypothetical protein GGI43DRAFT_430699 [Trichoderma evansii]